MKNSQVLIVAQSPFNLALMSDLLAANGVQTWRATTAAAALPLARDHTPTLVLIDTDLLPAECERLARDLSKDRATADIPVMVVVGESEKTVAQAVIDRLGASTLSKPIDTAGFPRTVLQEIRRRTTSAGRNAFA